MHVRKRKTVECGYATKRSTELLQCRTSDLTKLDLVRKRLVSTC